MKQNAKCTQTPLEDTSTDVFSMVKTCEKLLPSNKSVNIFIFVFKLPRAVAVCWWTNVLMCDCWCWGPLFFELTVYSATRVTVHRSWDFSQSYRS